MVACWTLVGSIYGQTYTASVQSVTVASGEHVIDSDAANPNPSYDRDLIELRPLVRYQRTSGSGNTSETFRLRYELLDPLNNAFQIKNSGGSAVTIFTGSPFSVNFPNNSLFDTEHLQFIAPFDRLNPDVAYRWKVTVQRETIPGIYVDLDDNVSPSRRYIHFRSMNPTDSEFNVVSQLHSVTFLRKTALDTALNANQRKFLARLTFSLHRYDNYEATAATTATVPFSVEYDLLRTVPAGSTNLTDNTAQPGFNLDHWVMPGSIREPHVRSNLTIDIELDPDEQLPSFSSNFLLRIDVAHREIPGGAWVDEATIDSATTSLLHMNGLLFAAGDSVTLSSATDETFTKSAPDNAVIAAPYITGDVTGLPGHLVNFGGLQYFLRVYDDGHAEMVQNLSFPVSLVDSPSYGAINNVAFERQTVTFNSVSGFTAGLIIVRLPAGLGFKFQPFEDRVPLALDSTVAGGGILLSQNLAPQGAVVFPAPSGEYVFLVEESKPFALIGQNLLWAPNLGQFSISGSVPAGENNVRYVRHAEVEALADVNLPITPDERVLRSNDLIYQKVSNTLTTPVVAAAANGSAKLTARVAIESAEFRSHFPLDAEIKADEPGQVDVVADVINPALSWMENIPYVKQPYARDALSSSLIGCGTIGPALTTANFSPDRLFFTPDGGLAGSGNVDGTAPQKNVLISYIEALSGGSAGEVHVHETTPFTKASFLMSGHFFGTNAVIDKMNDAPSVLLNSGYNPANLTEAHRPGTVQYENGPGDYPGINYRVSAETGTTSCISTLAGVTLAPYDMSVRTKYYVRAGGVSGIHEPTSVPGDLELYGYDATISSFGLSYLDSEVHDSVTEGSLKVPMPSDLILDFEGLKFDTMGRPSDAHLVGSGDLRTLAFWNADIRPFTFGFQPHAGAACDPTRATLTLGVEAYVANLTPGAHGVLGFNQNGTLVTGAQTDRPENVDSRLSLPNGAKLKGPQERDYTVYAAHGLYYDDYNLAPSQSSGTGRINLIGFVDVPFFEDLNVHLRTGASLNVPNSPVKLMAGWTGAGGETPFGSAAFDLNHRGFPHNDSLSDYENYALPDYIVHARKEWLDLFTFDYELEWSTLQRTFKARAPKKANFVVLQAEHTLTYMDPLWADLDFGANLNLGLPEISLQNMATEAFLSFSQIYEDQLAGAASDVTRRAIRGLDAGAGLLTDRMDDFYDRIFETVVDPVVDELADQIIAANGNLATIQSHVDNYMMLGQNSVMNRLQQVAQGISQGGNTVLPIIEEVDGRLADVQVAIRAIIGRLDVDEIGGEITAVTDNFVLGAAEDISGAGSGAIDGMFKKDADGYNVAESLLQSILTDVSSELAGVLTAEIDEQITALLARAEPTIEEVKSILQEVHNAISEIRTQIANGTGIYEEIEQRFLNAVTEIEMFMDEARVSVNEIMSQITIEEFDPEELKQMIRTEIRDRFNATELVAGVQNTLRQYLYDLDALMQEGIATLFAELNKTIVGAIAQFLPTDEEMEEYLGDLSNIAAAAEIDGYARIEGDSLRHLRLDGRMQLKLPDDFEFGGYVEINQLDSFGDSGCSFPTGEGSYAAEIKVAAVDVGANWIGDGLRFSVGCKFTFDTGPEGFNPRGMGGFLDMTEGEIGIEAVTINSLAAGAMFGLDENYIAARVGMKFDQYQFAGGVFFGRTCTMDPLLLVDPDFGSVLGNTPPFTGIYTYGEGQFPIFGASCFFSLQAIAGAGVFVFAEGPTIGGKMKAGVVGKALCAVEIGGEVTMMGVKQGNDFSFLGRGRLFGSAGPCPLCVEFDKSVEISYRDKTWEYEF